MLQQTTHNGDTHVGYFNMAVFAVPLRMKKAVLVRSNYIPRTFNHCGDVTVSYLLWESVKA